MSLRGDDEQAASLRVMTFNLRRDMGDWSWRRADRWSLRKHRVAALLDTERPAVLAAQEALPRQAHFVRSSLGAGYGCLGRGRGKNGSGEGCPVFYDAERLEVLDWQQFMLSETPQEAGSRFGGALFPRIMVSVEFRDRVSGSQFCFVNTHLDPLSRRARLRSIEMIRAHVASNKEPVVVAGDFNAGPHSEAMTALLENGHLIDAWHAAEKRTTPEYATYARYRPPQIGRRIDWIMTTPEIRVGSIAINAAQFDGGWPSDHLPVQATLELPSRVATHD